MIKSNYGLRSKALAASAASATTTHTSEPTRAPPKKPIQRNRKAKAQQNSAAPPSPPSSNGVDDHTLGLVDPIPALSALHHSKETYHQKDGVTIHESYGDEESYPSPPPLAPPSTAAPESISTSKPKQMIRLTIKSSHTKPSLSENLGSQPPVIVERPNAKSLIVRIRVQREKLPQDPPAAIVKSTTPWNVKKLKARADPEDDNEVEPKQRSKKPAAGANKRQKTQANIEEDEEAKLATARAQVLVGAAKIQKKKTTFSPKAKAPTPVLVAPPTSQAVAPAQPKKCPPIKGLTSRQMRSIASTAYLTTKPNSMRVGKGMTMVTKKRKRVLVIDVPEPHPDPQPERSPAKGPKQRRK